MKWFQHQSNAHRNKSIIKLTHKYGAEGYACYWYCLELICDDLGRTGPPTFELKHDAETIGISLKIDQLRVEEIMLYMVKLKLFETQDGVITCFKLAKNLLTSQTKNKFIQSIIRAERVTEGHRPITDPPGPITEGHRVDVDVDVDVKEKDQLPYVDVQQAEASTRGGNKRQKAIPYKQIQELYNKNFGFETWARSSSVLTDKTKKQIAKVNPHMETLDDWAGYFGFCSRDRWINGTTRDSDWKPDIDYLTREKTHAKMADTLGDNS